MMYNEMEVINMKKFTMIIDEKLHRTIKTVAAKLGTSMMGYIVETISADLKKRGEL